MASMTYSSVDSTRIKLFAALLSLWLLPACQDAVTEHSTTAKVQTVSSDTLVISPSYLHQQQYTGTVRAGNTTGVGFELAGKLNQLTADSGDRVEAGQILAKLDTRLLEAEQKELIASLAQNQADVDLASSTLTRSSGLKQQGYVSEQSLDEIKGQLSSLEAAQQRLIASLQANQLKRDKSSLLAPFAGTISKKHHSLGEVIGLGSPVFTLVGNDTPQAYIGVPVSVAQGLTTSQPVNIRIGSQIYNAKIAGISSEVNPLTRTVEVRVALPPSAQVLNGEIAYLNYQQEIIQAGFWVPISALTDGMRGLWNLYLVVKKDGLDIVERRDVEIIYTENDKAFIQGAISAGEHFVSQGLHKLVVGQQVNTSTQVAARSK